tara:strand:+ start:988 stop:1338 length:351 start_codon:yes stop_codon:yes gene_type:complete
MATINRYAKKIIYKNDLEQHEHLFKQRKLKFIRHFPTPVLKHASGYDTIRNEITVISKIWVQGDRLYKIADQYYEDPSLWWVIAWWNKTPTESHIRLGDVISIPMPLRDVLRIYNV